MIMSKIKVKIIDQSVTVIDAPKIYSGDINTDQVIFEFGEQWKDYTKTAVFYNDVEKPYSQLIYNNECNIPREVMTTKGRFYFGVFGVRDDEVYTSEIVDYDLGAGIITTGTAPSPNKDIWQQILSELGEIRLLAEQIKENEQDFINNQTENFNELKTDVDELINKAQTQQHKVDEQQTQIDSAIGVMGDYEVTNDDPTQIRFKKGNGQYGETVDLGDGLASKTMVNAGYLVHNGLFYSGQASNNGIDVARVEGGFSQENEIEEPDFLGRYDGTNYNLDFAVSGKNLYDFYDLQTGTFVDNGGATNGNMYYKSFYKYVPAGTYKIKAFDTTVVVVKAILNGVFLNTSQTVFVVNKPSYLGISFKLESSAVINGSENIQISLEEHSYKYFPPVSIESLTVALTKPLRALPNGIKDVLENGVATRKINKYTVDTINSLGTFTSTIGNRKFFTVIVNDKLRQDSGKNGFLCTKGIRTENTSSSIKDNCIYQTANNFVIVGTASDTLETFRAKFLGTSIYYEMIEPVQGLETIPTLKSMFPYTKLWLTNEVQPSNVEWHINTFAGSYVRETTNHSELYPALAVGDTQHYTVIESKGRLRQFTPNHGLEMLAIDKEVPKIAVVTKGYHLTYSPETEGNINIKDDCSYPNEFNSENCIVLAISEWYYSEGLRKQSTFSSITLNTKQYFTLNFNTTIQNDCDVKIDIVLLRIDNL